MGYIMDLRKYVGHQPLIMSCAGVLLLNEQKQLLLQRRADNGFWAYPGGSMELGETFEECAKREVLEETGIRCLDLTLFTIFSGKHYTYPNSDEIYPAEAIFICDKYEGELKLQEEEVKEVRFFDMDNLPQEITPMNIEPIQKLKEYLKNK